MPQEFYEESDAEAILRLAATERTGNVSRQNLLAAAAELGISVDVLERAEDAVLSQRQESELRKAFDKRSRGDFSIHLLVFGIVNLFLCGINQAVGPEYQWWLWVISSWGIALALHAAFVFLKSTTVHEAEYERWAEKRRGHSSGPSPLTIKAGISIGSKKD